jgi:hypothetical protein
MNNINNIIIITFSLPSFFLSLCLLLLLGLGALSGRWVLYIDFGVQSISVY